MPTSFVSTSSRIAGIDIITKSRSSAWSNTPGYGSIPRSQLKPQDFFMSSRKNTVASGQTTRCEPLSTNEDGSINVTTIVVPTLNMANDSQVPISADCSFVGDAYNQALNRFAAQATDGKVQLGVMFAERKKTADTVYKSATQIAGAITALRRGNISLAADSLGISVPRGMKTTGRRRSTALDEQWLALQYGWKPLLNDVEKSAQMLSQAINRSSTAFTIRASGSATTSSYSTDLPHGIRESRSDRSSCRIVGYSNIPDTFKQNLNSAGINIMTVASVAWELVPYSFVIDWFLPVGNYLQNSCFAQGLGIDSVYQSRKTETIVTCSGGNNMAPGQYGIAEGTIGASSYLMATDVSRQQTSIPSLPFPGFSDNPLNISRALNALALLSTAIIK